MEEVDFYLAIQGVDSALKKLDKTLMLELKHLQKTSHLSVIAALITLSLLLQGGQSSKHDDYATKQIIDSGKLRQHLRSLDPRILDKQTAKTSIEKL